MATQFMKKFFALEEKLTLSDLQHESKGYLKDCWSIFTGSKTFLCCAMTLWRRKSWWMFVSLVCCTNIGLILRICRFPALQGL